MNKKLDDEEAKFRTVLALLCLIIGTILAITSVFLPFIPLLLGIFIAVTGLTLFIMDTIFS